jgi:DNA processing protein
VTTACEACLRRTWLVGRLADHIARAHERFGALDSLLALDDDELLRAIAPSRRADLQESLAGFSAGPARARCASAGVTPVCRHDGLYPAGLREGPDPPAVVHVAGAVSRLQELLCGPAVGVVGARRATPYGLEVSRGLGRGLSAAGVTVVSGMALGVDSAAHAGALEAGGRTIAVLAGGADVPYPASKRWLHRRLREEACPVSEMPPGLRPRRWCFPARNRLIAGLAAVTVVVEAAERSGALITARLARDQGREVGAVPGQVTSPRSRGTNALLRDGAHLVRDAQDVLDLLFGAGGVTVPAPDPAAHLEEPLRRVLDAVAGGRDTVSSLAATPGEIDGAMVALSRLELLGHVRRGPGGRYLPVT